MPLSECRKPRTQPGLLWPDPLKPMGSPSAFDRSLLPDALAEIVILADTHEVRIDDSSTVEFASRKQQSIRAKRALELAASLSSDALVHLGDLVQDYPDGPGFGAAFGAVKQRLKRHHPNLRLVAGNHDVGDKPDLRMPTHPTTAAGLQALHKAFGRSWYRFEVAGVAAYVLNTQIMNTALAARPRQRKWFEQTLERETRKRRLLFIHLPLYLDTPDEPDVGHYDNLAEPDRSWLLRLIKKHRFEAVFAGHVHTRFFDRIGRARYMIVGSTSFTRPGFGHMFSSAPPPERGRDDQPKLGFGLLRIHSRGSVMHWIRTAEEKRSAGPPGLMKVLTPVSGERSPSPLGFTLCHALSSRHDIPMAWPSMIRVPVRNDHPFLALTEMGTGWIRTSWRDFIDPFQQERLTMLKAEGVALTAIVDLPEIAQLQPHANKVLSVASDLEVRIARGEFLDRKTGKILASMRTQTRSLTVSPILPGTIVPGKQHPRTGTAWAIEDLGPIQLAFEAFGLPVDRWRVLTPSSPFSSPIPGGLDLTVEFTDDDQENLNRAAWGLAQVAAGKGRRLSLYPLRDLDRTMDRHHGALDTLCNPRPVLNAVRILTAILFPPGTRKQPARELTGTLHGWKLTDRSGTEITFFSSDVPPDSSMPFPSRKGVRTSLYNLQDGTVRLLKPNSRTRPKPEQPTLWVSKTD